MLSISIYKHSSCIIQCELTSQFVNHLHSSDFTFSIHPCYQQQLPRTMHTLMTNKHTERRLIVTIGTNEQSVNKFSKFPSWYSSDHSLMYEANRSLVIRC
ncbi:hypothetical protein QVD17_31055 [Tagetes erecta]|uniref:Uncharacterized protein n=1 Tax=Tagetes erecta TaxID=13708 RepID=A0AAD8NNH7_TARER|nr:hypothetical protein QVD17_31055 [Tagetes erecta]